MLAKKMIIRLMEEFLGEYIINISKENLKVAVIRGKIKLENVQLDGDLIGSHVLSAVGLSGFAVISCTAEKLRASIPWSKLEKEPTTFELVGLQLVCVPLLPSNACQVFGSGKRLDPRCTLRTRVKRSALARFERNFFSCRIPGEGPKRQPTQKRRGRNRRGNGNSVSPGNDDISIDPGSVYSTNSNNDESYAGKEANETERNAWRDQLVEKLFRNIEIVISDVHVRCEVCKGALDDQRTSCGASDRDSCSFAFGFDVNGLYYKSANSQWETGNVDWGEDKKKSKRIRGSSSKDRISIEPEKKYKVLQINGLSMYWDDEPHVLLSECPILRSPNDELTSHKILSRIRMAMDGMKKYKQPGDDICSLLGIYKASNDATTESSIEGHVHILKGLALEVRLTFTSFGDGRAETCSAEMSPCDISIFLSKQQLRQRRMLEFTMLAQRRLDSMLHQRPKQRPTEDPRAWWKYVISCVMTCPNSRPWRDVKRIVQHRSHYVRLVEKKHLKKGLDDDDSAKLLSLEEELPIETLLSFHLLALRNVVQRREQIELSPRRRIRSRSRQRKNNCDDDQSCVSALETDSVISSKSILTMSKSPLRRRTRKSSGKKIESNKDKDELTIATDFEDLALGKNREVVNRGGISSPVKSPLRLPKKPGLGYYRSPKKEKAPKSLDDLSHSNSVTSQGTAVLDVSAHSVEIPYFGFDDIFIPDEVEEAPPMKKVIRGHTISIAATLVDDESRLPILKASVHTMFWAKNIYMEGTSLLFDFKSIDVIDCNDIDASEVLTFDQPDREINNEGIFSNEGLKDDTSEVTLPKELYAFKSFDDEFFLDSFCSQTLAEDMPLPPSGIVCRLLITFSEYGKSISLSARAATLVWNTSCVNAFREAFFPSQSLEARSILKTQLRNSATPLAHKTQVAWTSPRSLSVKIIIDVPRLWFPVSQVASHGALYVDSGRFSMSLTKPELVSNVLLSIDSTGIYAKFRRDTGSMFHPHEKDISLEANDISVIEPFDFHLEMDRCGDGPAFRREQDGVEYHVTNNMTLVFSAVSVSLVDVEVLALAIGRWYAAELLIVKRRIEGKRSEMMELSRSEFLYESNPRIGEEVINIQIEKIELYLQSRGKDDRYSGEKRKRTYLVQVMCIEGGHCSRDDTRISEIGIAEFRIIEQKEVGTPPAKNSHNEILSCSNFANNEQKRSTHASKILSKSPDEYSLNIAFIHEDRNHFDDLDVNVGRLIVCLTPSTLTDSSIALDRIVESIEIITKEMERRCHRSVRHVETKDDGELRKENIWTSHLKKCQDSIFVGKVNIEETVILIRWKNLSVEPTEKYRCSNSDIVQLAFSIAGMFQSSENIDTSGKKVFHISLDNFRLCSNETFKINRSNKSEWLSPFGAEIRVVHSTVNYGEVVSKEFSLDSDAIYMCIHIDRLHFIVETFHAFYHSVRKLSSRGTSRETSNVLKTYQKQGASIATILSFQFQPWSLVLLSSIHHSNQSLNPLLKLEGSAVGNFEGCMCALSGEVKTDMALFFFSPILKDWIFFVEQIFLQILIEVQPNDLALDILIQEQVNLNLSSEIIKHISSECSVWNKTLDCKSQSASLSLERMLDDKCNHLSLISNDSGIDLIISKKEPLRAEVEEILIQSGNCTTINFNEKFSVDLELGDKSKILLGNYLPLHDLSILPKDEEINILYYLIPEHSSNQTRRRIPDNMEPVVEYCIQNQRLRSAFNDVSALDDGSDLLSSETWSPSSQIFTHDAGHHWLHPYLDDDTAEWSDTSGSFRLMKDEAMLPDNSWVWADEWRIELAGDYEKDSDADGWEYAEDFTKFQDGKRKRRFFRAGDVCRRRKWTRTRLTKAQLSDKIAHPVPLVWRLSFQDNRYNVSITSHITIKNNTNISRLLCFGYKLPWQRDKLLGSLSPGENLAVPIDLASMTHLRLGIEGKCNLFNMSDRIMILPTSQSYQHRLSLQIYLDTAKEPNSVLASKALHFIILLQSKADIIEILIEPVLKVQNLLPCSAEFRLIEAAKQFDCDGKAGIHILNTDKEFKSEESELKTGEETCSSVVDPSLNPSIAVRVPGYRWSSYQLIVNRRHAETSWKPTELVEKHRYQNRLSNEKSGSYTSIIRLESQIDNGDPLAILLEVDPGHAPILRIYAQYWINDQSGFGLRICDGPSDLLGKPLGIMQDRRTYTHRDFLKGNDPISDGHEWAIGENGMSMFFSPRQRMAVAVDFYKGDTAGKSERKVKSAWSQSLDLSNVISSVFSVNESNSERKYDFSYEVTTGPSIFVRTKIVYIFSRFRVANLSLGALYLRQEGSSNGITFVPPVSEQLALPFHWEDASLPSNINLSTNCVDWTKGSVNIEKVGVTAIKLDTMSATPPVLQVEVRLATLEQKCAVIIIIWNPVELQPIYQLRNLSSHTIVCCQMQDEERVASRKAKEEDSDDQFDIIASVLPGCSAIAQAGNMTDLVTTGLDCNFISNRSSENRSRSIWTLRMDETKDFGFDYPQKPHILEWNVKGAMKNQQGIIEVDSVGSTSNISLSHGVEVACIVKATDSAKVIEFSDTHKGIIESMTERLRSFSPLTIEEAQEDSDHVAVTMKVSIPGAALSIIENHDEAKAGQEIFLLSIDESTLRLSQNSDGYHDIELRIMSIQIDNHIPKVAHPVLLTFLHQGNEPALHLSAVKKKRLQNSATVFKYVAVRLLDITIALDRETTQAVHTLSRPLLRTPSIENDAAAWLQNYTDQIRQYNKFPGFTSSHKINTDRIYIEQLNLHPIRISFTFTQQWNFDQLNLSEGSALLHYIRLTPSIHSAPISFTSFLVRHVFESPQVLKQIIQNHYLSQARQCALNLVGSLAILQGPADFLTNIGTGVRDFVYHPINGSVHGPEKFWEGVETGSLSLARGVFNGVFRGAANVTGIVNSNLVALTDEHFIEERNAYQRTLTDFNQGDQSKSISDILSQAGTSVAHGITSGAMGLVEEPLENFNKQGTAGFVRGMGSAIISAIVKPAVGLGDGAIIIMKHGERLVGDSCNVLVATPKRLRRALPRKFINMGNSVLLDKYDELSSMAQNIVECSGNHTDAYISHMYSCKYLFIASESSLWIINRRTDEQECLQWEEISHFYTHGGCLILIIFTELGVSPKVLECESIDILENVKRLMSMQANKMTNTRNCSFGNNTSDFFMAGSHYDIIGVKVRQQKYIFGSVNCQYNTQHDNSLDNQATLDHCHRRVRFLQSDSSTFFSSLDEEAWGLISTWRNLYSGIHSRRCLVSGLINGTGEGIQIKSTTLLEGGSPICRIPAGRDFDELNSILKPGGAIIFFAWGVSPNLNQRGSIHLEMDSNVFLSHFSSTTAIATPRIGYSCIFLERSISDWWAKFWLLITPGHGQTK